MPATGNRHRESGAGVNRGTNGNYWSGEMAGTNSPRLNFNSGGADVNANNRANGFSVRCVQVFAKLLCDGRAGGFAACVIKILRNP